MKHARASQHGAALILVMWLVALLIALIGAFATSARIEYMQGRTLSRGLVAEQAARAGLEYALTRIFDLEPTAQWLPDGRAYPWAFEGAEVQVRIVDETAKVDLNAADINLLSSLFQAVGAEPDVASAVAAAIVDWRDSDSLSQPSGGAEDPHYASAGLPYGAKDGPFETVGEVEQVLGMTPDLFEAAATHLTVHSGQPLPDPRFASGEVLQALGVDPTAILAARERSPTLAPLDGSVVGGGSGTYSIDSRARLPDGRQAVLRAVVRTGPGGVPGSAYTPLQWEEGASAR